MASKPKFIRVHMDSFPGMARDPMHREKLREHLTKELEKEVPGMISRFADLPDLMLSPGEYVQLLVEARDLYVRGFFYSCVAMCGIVGERLIKDLLRASLCVKKGKSVRRASDAAFDQLERVEVSGLTNFANKCGLISDQAKRAADKLAQLRNSYAHARGKDAQPDALKAITLLHEIVDDTVSILKNFEIRDGRLVPKQERDTGRESSGLRAAHEDA